MKHETFRVAFQPEGRSVFVMAGTKIIEAAGQAGIIINTPCGGQGTCGKCKVQVQGEAPEPVEAERDHLSREELAAGLRLACQLGVDRDMVVTVPRDVRFFEQVILTEGVERDYAFDPNVRKKYVTLPEPSLEDLRSCVDRLKDSVAEGDERYEADIDFVRDLPSLVKSADFKATVVLRGSSIQGIECGDTTDSLWGVAFDVGTTTIVGCLVNLNTGRQVAVAGRTNPQVQFGDDVVSRIHYAETNGDGLKKLQGWLITCLNEIVEELARTAGISPRAIYEATAVGNTTMNHILLGLDPTSIGHAPYVAVLRESMDVKARNLALKVNENAYLHTLSNIGGFVGSDTVGMILASGMMHEHQVQLAIDIGTNGEVAIGNRDKMLVCSCAAGPALEGARIRYGMRATEGAISKVIVNDQIDVSVIGGGRARGICGSGLIDAVAQLLNAGLIDDTGRIVGKDKLPSGVPKQLAKALVEVDDAPAVVLVDAHNSRIGEPIVLTQRDIRELQLAKGAIRAGTQLLVREFGVEIESVSRVLLAGGFGNFIRRSNAKRIGLLPSLPTSRIEFIGNAAAAGAKMALTSRSCRREADRISRFTTFVELATRTDFQMFFSEAMMFPRQK